MNRMLSPCSSCKRRISRTMCSVSASLIPAVGSSSSRSRGFMQRAKAISTARWSPCANSPTTRYALFVRSTSSITAATCSLRLRRVLRDRHGQRLTPAAASTATRMLSNTVKSGKTSVIWKVRTMPRATRPTTVRRPIFSPSNHISPAVAGRKPLMILKKVVLPAPFCPMTARNSPGAISKETSSSARSAPKWRLTCSRRNSFAACPCSGAPSPPTGKTALSGIPVFTLPPCDGRPCRAVL